MKALRKEHAGIGRRALRPLNLTSAAPPWVFVIQVPCQSFCTESLKACACLVP